MLRFDGKSLHKAAPPVASGLKPDPPHPVRPFTDVVVGGPFAPSALDDLGGGVESPTEGFLATLFCVSVVCLLRWLTVFANAAVSLI